MGQLRVSASTRARRRRGARRTRRWAWHLAAALALALVAALALAQQQAHAVAPAPPPQQSFDLGAWITGLVQRYGPAGFLALVAGALLWTLLSQAQNIESARRLLGFGRQPEPPAPAPGNATYGPSSPQFIGGEHHHTHLPSAPKAVPPTTAIPHNLPQATSSAVAPSRSSSPKPSA